MKRYVHILSLILLIHAMSSLSCQMERSSPFREKSQNNELQNSKYSATLKKGGLDTITWLEKADEIKDGFCDEELNYFVRITSLCLDSEDNFFVSDSGLHKIFKFNNRSKYICSFGSHGQGPGEFVGTLRLTMSNSKKLYVTDAGNRRLLIFSSDGNFIQQFPIRSFLRDAALANSNGEIFLLSPSRLKIIDVFDSNMKIKQSLFDMNYHLSFPYQKPTQRILSRIQQPSIAHVKKLLTKEDELFVIFNSTQTVFYLENNRTIIKKFRIKHPRLIKDYIARLRETIKKGGWLNCFGSVFFDPEENLCLGYFNASLGIPEIYRYTKNGSFIDTLRVQNLSETTNKLISACDSRWNFFSINQDSSTVRIYRITN